jgi:hypothetical protein
VISDYFKNTSLAPAREIQLFGSPLYQFQIKDDLKAARIEAARRTEEYVEQPKTSQRREGLDMELELPVAVTVPVTIVTVSAMAGTIVPRHMPVVRPALVVADTAFGPKIYGRPIRLHPVIHWDNRDTYADSDSGKRQLHGETRQVD